MGRIGNAYADELAGNGLFTFAAAMRRNELDYDRFYATMPQEDADRILAALGVERRPLQRSRAGAMPEPRSRSDRAAHAAACRRSRATSC